MTEQDRSLSDAATELSGMVQALDESVQAAVDVRNDLDRLVAKAKTTRTVMTFVIAGLILDVLLTVVMVIIGVRAAENTRRIDAVVKIQHDAALCPVYKLFIDADRPDNNARAAKEGLDLVERERQFEVIRKSYNALHCPALK